MLVLLYTYPNCKYSQVAKSFFNQYQIPYDEHNLENNPKLQAALHREFGEIGTPLIMIGRDAFIGFNKEGIKRVLNLS